ncbi:hypothetical protein LMG19282_01498 [Cupriavidus campinensis]|uniref:hypothetical protein n=1 Tax=Cupriavidus campinensis TaxID=151783 RepID=UPI001642BB5F|nr:hypothetical protein [Cupriavidus campinensis]CAG2138450.1 hypothetical protein LMG19282_01498 [Cupriavidus campinensis]
MNKQHDPGLGLRPQSNRQKLTDWVRENWLAIAGFGAFFGFLAYDAIEAQFSPFIR